MKRKPKSPARRQDWPSRLFAFIEQRRHMPFTWGSHDCCLFACDGIRSQTGLDPAAKLFRGRYRDAAGAVRLVRKHGGIEAIAESVCRAHGFEELASPLLAQRGDVVLVEVEDGMKHAVGLCLGAECAFAGTDGLVMRGVAECCRAWRVTHHQGGKR